MQDGRSVNRSIFIESVIISNGEQLFVKGHPYHKSRKGLSGFIIKYHQGLLSMYGHPQLFIQNSAQKSEQLIFSRPELMDLIRFDKNSITEFDGKNILPQQYLAPPPKHENGVLVIVFLEIAASAWLYFEIAHFDIIRAILSTDESLSGDARLELGAGNAIPIPAAILALKTMNNAHVTYLHFENCSTMPHFQRTSLFTSFRHPKGGGI
jgi:hypothetical protein